MSQEATFWWLVVVIAAGTYLTRYLPFYLLKRWQSRFGSTGRFTEYLEHVGPAIIAALLAVSFAPEIVLSGTSVLVALAGLVATAASWWCWRNTGLSVFAGIAGYAVLSLWLR